jgi:hypothetical protein
MARRSGASASSEESPQVPITRMPYDNLPPPIRLTIENAVGPVIATEPITDGLNSAVAAKLHTTTGSYFVKALPADHRWVWTQAREANIAAHVKPVAPAIVTRIADEGWDVLIFEALPGRHADYAPDSPDLPKIVDLIERIGDLPCPDLDLRRAEQRLQAYMNHPDDLAHFAGDTLLHTDWNPTNVIIDEQARIVDWGWATRGAPWLDAGYWTIWLIAAGHQPASAEAWAAQTPAWRAAPHLAVDAFAAATARLWAETGGAQPDPWTERLVDASSCWHDFRRHRNAAD